MDDIIKEKEEVQQFLNNLGIEYRFSCYSENNPQGCQLLADYLTQIHKDYEKANKVLKDNCDKNNYGRSCTGYGQNLLNGRGCRRDYPEALKYLVKGCENNDAAGCDTAGKIYAGFEPSLRKRYTPDPEQGLKYLLKGCYLKSSAQYFESSESCYAAAYMYASGMGGLPKDDQKAVEVGTRSCDMGQMKACMLVSNAYKRIGDMERCQEFLKRYETLKKQSDDAFNIEMERT